MKITKFNYEAFVLDYLEGSLNEEMQLEMNQFLAEHPDLNAEIKSLNQFKFEANENIVFVNKNSLLKKEKKAPAFWFIIPLLFVGLLFFVGYTFLNPTTKQSAPEIKEAPIEVKKENKQPIAKEEIKDVVEVADKELVVLEEEKEGEMKLKTIEKKINPEIVIGKKEKENIIVVEKEIKKQGNRTLVQPKKEIKIALYIPELLPAKEIELLAEKPVKIVAKNFQINTPALAETKTRKRNKFKLFPNREGEKITLTALREALIPESINSRQEP